MSNIQRPRNHRAVVRFMARQRSHTSGTSRRAQSEKNQMEHEEKRFGFLPEPNSVVVVVS